MTKKKLWYGFLEAGSKSSPVVIDRNMETGNGSTVFVYNHNKGEILKYVRELVEPKLRELTAQEKKLESSLKKGFSESVKTLKFAAPKVLNLPETESLKPKTEKVPLEEELEIEGLDADATDDNWEDSDD